MLKLIKKIICRPETLKISDFSFTILNLKLALEVYTK